MTISTPEDFKRAAEREREAHGQELQLPSGLTVLAYQPSPEWWVREIGRLPQSMAARVTGLSAMNGNGEITTETLIEFARWTQRLLEAVVLKPKIRLHPQGTDEIDPNVISDDDLAFLIKYAGGEITAAGRDLESFSRQRRSTVEPDLSGRPLEHATKSTT